MTAANPPLRPMLRLVYPPGYPGVADAASDFGALHDPPHPEIAPPPPPAQVRAAARDIARENRRAASLSQSEAREILTLRVTELLQGGRAAILTPERRTRAIRIARMLGVRDFDAHLVIAVVQDRARRGEIALPATGVSAAGAKSAVGDDFPPRSLGEGRGTIIALQVAAATLLAAAMLLGVMNWLG
jgi:hypothetical protein